MGDGRTESSGAKTLIGWLVKANERWVGVVAFGRSEQDGEAFLIEVVVVSQNFGDRFLGHDQHGDAVGEAVFLVRAGFVERKTAQERLGRLRVHGDGWVSARICLIANRQRIASLFPTAHRFGLGKLEPTAHRFALCQS